MNNLGRRGTSIVKELPVVDNRQSFCRGMNAKQAGVKMQILLPQQALHLRRAGLLVSAAFSPPSSSSCVHCDDHLSLSFAKSSLHYKWLRRPRVREHSATQKYGERDLVVRMSNSGRSGGVKTISSDSSMPPAATAKEAIESGLSLFSKGRVKDALNQFDAALKMSPDSEEAQAALYNKACCHAYREEGENAAKALRQALGEYGLKFSVILNDPDMAPFRAMPEFRQLQDEARKGGEEVGQSFRRDLKLISEVQAPFRGVRKFFYVAFTMAAGLATVFTVPRLILAIQGGEGAPGIVPTSQNLAINLGGIVISVALYIWDNKKEEEQMVRISRDETLSRLPLRLQSNRIVELAQIRENTRPVIVAGKKEAVNKAVQRAQRFREELLKRGVLVIPIVWSLQKQEPVKKKGFGSLEKLPLPTPVPLGDDFEKRAEDIAAKAVIQSEWRFKAEPVSPVEWESWIRDQQASEGVTPGEDVFIVLRLDGRVRKSGLGMPDWQELINELPPLDALVSKLEK